MNTDGNKPESVVNLTGNRNGVLATAWVSFTVGVTWLWTLVTGSVSVTAVPGNNDVAMRLCCLMFAGHNKVEACVKQTCVSCCR